MSVTISDILKLPSLHGARVAAGHSSLESVVSSVSVLESVDGMDDLPGLTRYYGHEILLTGFIAIKDDVEKQCNAIRLMHKSGEIGVILFYVGDMVKELDARLIETAEELKMPLIVMPEYHMELRYSDVICEVMEAVLNDRRENSYFATDIIEQISHIKDNQRSINGVLSAIRDRIQCSVFLFDEVGRLINMAEWPNGRGLNAGEILAEVRKTDCIGECVEVTVSNTSFFAARDCLNNSDTKLDMLIVKERSAFSADWCKQVKYIVKTYLNLWTENYAQLDTKQLLSALINNETEKMRRIADILKIDVRQMDCAYFFVCDGDVHSYDLLKDARRIIRNFLQPYKNVFLTEIFDETIVVMANRNRELFDADIEALLDEISDMGLSMRAASYNYVPTTLKVKQAYWQLHDMKKYLNIIFPKRRMVTSGEIAFIEKATVHFESSSGVQNANNPEIQELYGEKREGDLIETLEVYLLDANLSVQKTAEFMFTHPNTVKYRLRCIERVLGHKLTKIPEAYNLYLMAATNRLNRAL